MVFTLLAEVIALHVRPIAVDVQGLSLEFVSISTFRDVKECLDNSIQVLLTVLISIRILGNRKKGSLRGSSRSFRSSRSLGSSKSLRGSKFV